MIICKFPAQGAPNIKDIPNTLEALQAEVGGYIEVAPLITQARNVAVICNEEGRFIGLRTNNWIPQLLGDVIVVGVDGEEFCSLDVDQIGAITRQFVLKGGNK